MYHFSLPAPPSYRCLDLFNCWSQSHYYLVYYLSELLSDNQFLQQSYLLGFCFFHPGHHSFCLDRPPNLLYVHDLLLDGQCHCSLHTSSSLLLHKYFRESYLQMTLIHLDRLSSLPSNLLALLFHSHNLWQFLRYFGSEDKSIPLDKLLHWHSDCEALLSDSDRFQHSCASKLLAYVVRVDLRRWKLWIGLNTSNISWTRFFNGLDQLIQL